MRYVAEVSDRLASGRACLFHVLEVLFLDQLQVVVQSLDHSVPVRLVVTSLPLQGPVGASGSSCMVKSIPFDPWLLRSVPAKEKD
jgi:hypothetical protein